MGVSRYQDLTVWKHAHRLVLGVYRVTRTYPTDERFGLISQMRRAAISIPANIAGGFGRLYPYDKARFYNYGQSSLEELSYYVLVSRDLGCLKDDAEREELLDSIGRMLRRLVQTTIGHARSFLSPPP